VKCKSPIANPNGCMEGVEMVLGNPLEDCGSFSYNEGVITATESSTSMMQRDQRAGAKSMIHKWDV
jgi:hypothetical protein